MASWNRNLQAIWTFGIALVVALSACADDAAPPHIEDFSATSPFVLHGQGTTLSWASEGAGHCTLHGGELVAYEVPAVGTRQTGPLEEDTRYTLTCTGAGGTSAPIELTVAVREPLSITRFALQDETNETLITRSVAAVLLVEAQNAESCALSDGTVMTLVPGQPGVYRATVAPALTTTYDVTCAGAPTSSSASEAGLGLVVVRVRYLDPTLTVTPDLVSVGEEVTLGFSGAELEGCTLAGPNEAYDVLEETRAHTVIAPSGGGTFTLSCDGWLSAAIDVTPLEVTSFEVPGVAHPLGTSAQVAWTAARAEGCELREIFGETSLAHYAGEAVDARSLSVPRTRALFVRCTARDAQEQVHTTDSQVKLLHAAVAVPLVLDVRVHDLDHVVVTNAAEAATSCVLTSTGQTIPAAGSAIVSRSGSLAGVQVLRVRCFGSLEGDAADSEARLWWGDASQGDLAALAGVSRLTGALSFADVALTSESMQSLSSLVEVGAALRFENVTGLDAPGGGLSSLRHIGGDLRVVGNDGMSSLSLPGLRSVGGSVTISSNADLAAIDMDLLEEIGDDLVISQHMSIDMIVSMDSLHDVGRDMVLLANYEMSSMRLDRLYKIGRDMRISYNISLVLLSADSLVEIGGNFTMMYGYGAETYVSMEMLSMIGGSLVIEEYPLVSGLSMPSLTQVSGSVSVERVESMEELTMPSLARVHRLIIRGNPGIVSIDMASLERVSGGVEMQANASLRELHVSSLTEVEGGLNIRYNDQLPCDEVVGVLCGLDLVSGTVVVSPNQSVCTPSC